MVKHLYFQLVYLLVAMEHKALLGLRARLCPAGEH